MNGITPIVKGTNLTPNIETKIVGGISVPLSTSTTTGMGRKLSIAELKIPWKIQGILCAAAEVRFHETGNIQSATLEIDHLFDGKINLKEKTIAIFHGNGALYRGILSGNQIIGSFSFPDGTAVQLSESGRLRYADLHLSHNILGINFPSGSHIVFNDDGSLKGANLSENMQIQGINCLKGGYDLFFPMTGLFPDGRLEHAHLSEPHKIQDINFPAYASLWFYPSGKLKSATINSGFKIRGISCDNRVEIDFWERIFEGVRTDYYIQKIQIQPSDLLKLIQSD